VRRARGVPPVRVRSPRTEVGGLGVVSLGPVGIAASEGVSEGVGASAAAAAAAAAASSMRISLTGSLVLGSCGCVFASKFPPRPLPRPLPLPLARPRSPFAGPRGMFCACCDWPRPPEGCGGASSGICSSCGISMGFCSTTGSATGVKSSSKKRSSVEAVCAKGSMYSSA